MVGTLIDIGKDLLQQSVSDIIKSKNRMNAGTTAPACGLYLTNIKY